MKGKKILFFVSEDWYFWTHRRSIAVRALETGFDVTLVTRVHKHDDAIRELGIKLIQFDLKRSSLNPFREVVTILRLIKIFQKEKPDIVHNVALKPVLYGTWVSRFTGVKGVVNTFGGLGHLFSSNDWRILIISKLIKLLMRSSFSKKNIRLILQNTYDQDLIIENQIVPRERTRLIRGAGANLEIFRYSQEMDNKPMLLYAGRLLWSKGVEDLVRASEILLSEGRVFRTVLVGRPDPENPRSIPESKLEEWQRKGFIEWWGYREDMASVLEESTIVVLPTRYGEGVPKILIEAAATGRPIVATDIPGCRDIVRNNINGLLIPCFDTDALVSALMTLLSDKNLRHRMGIAGRKLVENEFSEKSVTDAVLDIYNELII